MRVMKTGAAMLLASIVTMAAVTEVVYSQGGGTMGGTQSAPPAGSSPSPSTGSTGMTPGGGPAGTTGQPAMPGSSTFQADQESIRQAQQQLQSAGFSPGPINGIMNDETRTALQQFQQSKGLNATGQLDQETWSALRSMPGTTLPSERSGGSGSGGAQ